MGEYSKTAQLSFTQGNRVGEVARTLHPDGILIGHDQELVLAIAQTHELLVNQQAPTLFEATFAHEGVLIRADILQRTEQGFRLVEVKSSTSVKSHYVYDCAVQAWVINQAGFPLTQIELAHVDNLFVYPGEENYQGLLLHNDLSEEVSDMLPEVGHWVASCHDVLAGDVPDVEMGAQCTLPYACPFISFCSPPESEYPLRIIPRGGRLIQDLEEDGYKDLREVPHDRLRNDIQRRVLRTTLSGTYELDDEARMKLSALPYPRYFIDFETIQFAVPIWVGTRSWAQLPFQWSCHAENADGKVTHSDFLGTDGGDPQRAFAETLIAAVGNAGPIFVWNAQFERGRLQELAELLPDLANELHLILDRMVDLLPIAREHYYHPAMMGSWSIKKVLPTIAPELAYENLEQVQDGALAQMAYLQMLAPETLADEKSRLELGLRRYCERDTLAMVRIAHFLERKDP